MTARAIANHARQELPDGLRIVGLGDRRRADEVANRTDTSRRSAPATAASCRRRRSASLDRFVGRRWSAWSPRGRPHSPQNRSPGRLAAPHAGQARASVAPHWAQNFRSARFSVPHAAQCTLDPPSSGQERRPSGHDDGVASRTDRTAGVLRDAGSLPRYWPQPASGGTQRGVSRRHTGAPPWLGGLLRWLTRYARGCLGRACRTAVFPGTSGTDGPGRPAHRSRSTTVQRHASQGPSGHRSRPEAVGCRFLG